MKAREGDHQREGASSTHSMERNALLGDPYSRIFGIIEIEERFELTMSLRVSRSESMIIGG